MAEWLVGHGLDDAYETDAGTGFSNSSVVTGSTSDTVAASRYNSGYRFTAVNIPKGSTIDSATIDLYFYTKTFDDMNADIYAEDVDDAVNFDDDQDVTSRTPTSASAAWIEDALAAGGVGFYTSPDFKSVIQEIVNRAGWASGQAIVILIKGKDDQSKVNWLYSYDQAAEYGAKLNVTWTPPAAGGGRRDVALLGVGRGIARGAR